MTAPNPDRLCFERLYTDDGSVEFGVEYVREPYLHDEDIVGVINLTHVGEITLPVTELDWLISCLTRIRDDIG